MASSPTGLAPIIELVNKLGESVQAYSDHHVDGPIDPHADKMYDDAYELHHRLVDLLIRGKLEIH